MINIPIWMAVLAVVIAVLPTVAMTILHLKLLKHSEGIREERHLLNINIANLMTNEVRSQAEKRADHMRYRKIKHIDIKSAIISTDFDGTGNTTLSFANGVVIKGAELDGTVMDS